MDEFSYPFLIRSRTGDYHLSYTWKRRRIAHVQFNDAWLETLNESQNIWDYAVDGWLWLYALAWKARRMLGNS